MLTDQKISAFVKDDFTITAVEPWFKVKVQVIQEYMQAFVAETTGRVNEIILVDLFAGSGFYSIGHQRDVVPMPCLAALIQDPPFSKVILCEQDSESAKALKIRVNRYFKGRNVLLFDDKVQQVIEKLHLYIPPSKKDYKVSVLCLVDPFSFRYEFKLLEKMANLGYTLLIPYVFQLNSRSDFRHYLKEKRSEVNQFLGHSSNSVLSSSSNTEFYKKLVRSHQNNLMALGYSVSLSAHKIESTYFELPSFTIGLFSKQVSAKGIARDVKENSHLQFELF
jgi:three-Cys-motif partner protein